MGLCRPPHQSRERALPVERLREGTVMPAEEGIRSGGHLLWGGLNREDWGKRVVRGWTLFKSSVSDI